MTSQSLGPDLETTTGEVFRIVAEQNGGAGNLVEQPTETRNTLPSSARSRVDVSLPR